METEAVFSAEGREDAQLIATSSPAGYGAVRQHGPQSSQKAQDNMDNEDTALLSVRSCGDLDSEYTTLHTPWLGVKETQDKPWWRRPSIFWLLPPLLLSTIAFGGVAVPKINLILTLICRDYLSERASKDPAFSYLPVVLGNDNPQCRLPEIQARVSRFQLLINLITGTLAALASPRLGLLSDGYGRNKVVALSTLGTLLGEVVTVLVAARPDTFSVNFLLLGASLDGLFGSITTALAVAQSYAADCIPPERRNVAFGYFHGVLFTGIALGPFIAGYLVKWTGHVLVVFYGVLFCHLFFLVFVLFIAPESVSKERQQYNRDKRGIALFDFKKVFLLSWNDLNPLNVLKPLSILYPVDDTTSPLNLAGKADRRDLRRNLVLLASIDTAIFGVAMGTMSIIVIYAEYMFGWGNFESSIFVSITSSVRVIVLLAILPAVTRVVRGPQKPGLHVNAGSDMLDIIIIRVSVLFDLFGYIGYSCVRTGPLLTLSAAVAAVGTMASPTLQSSLTKHVPPDLTGQLLGVIGLLHALARVIGPTVFNLIYSLTVGGLPQAVFMCLSSVFGVALILTWFIKPHVCMSDSVPPDGHIERNDSDQDRI